MPAAGMVLARIANGVLDWNQLLFGENDRAFLLSVALRTGVMFLVILLGLRILGKRGVHQLSVFELGVIIGLGSAAGDPMFYQDVGLLSCVVVFVVVLAMYRLLELSIEKSDRIADAVEGKPRTLARDGALDIDAVEHEKISRPELFSQLRVKGVTHLGQVRLAVLEPSGVVSTFFRRDAEVTPGLPILPELFDANAECIDVSGAYACTRCGHTASFGVGDEPRCPRCGRTSWVRALDEARVG